MPAQQNAVPFAKELLALLDRNSFEIEVSLLDDDLPEQKRTLSDNARKDLDIEMAVIDECFERKQYPWAIDAQKNALKIYEENLGVLSIETLECLRDLGNLYVWDKKYEEARTCFLRAWRIALSALPRKHEFLKSVEALYQECISEMEKSRHVATLNQHMAKIIATSVTAMCDVEGISKIQSPHDLDAGIEEAQGLLASGRHEEAERLLRMGAKYLGGVTEPQLRTKLKVVFELWANALEGLGHTGSAGKTRLLAQRM